MNDKSRKSLTFFVEKYERLNRRTFTRYFRKHKELSVTLPFAGKPKVKVKNPTEESIDAFLLTFRLFCQDRDGIAIRILKEEVLEDPEISFKWKEQFKVINNEWDDILNEHVPFVFDGKAPTHLEVLNVILYGHYAHIDDKHLPQLEEWNKDPLDFPHYEMDFITTLINLFIKIEEIAKITREELSDHKSDHKWSKH